MSVQEDEPKPAMKDTRASSKPDASDSPVEENPTGVQNPANGEAADKPLEVQLEEEKERAQANLASWQRSAADFQNFKRRGNQEREEMARLANASLMFNLLPLMDDLERALENVEPHVAALTWLDGIRLIHRKFEALFEAHGASEISTDGAAFDPAVHEAVMFGEGEEGKVISVVQKGYMLGGRVLRPAMVVVGKSGAAEQF